MCRLLLSSLGCTSWMASMHASGGQASKGRGLCIYLYGYVYIIYRFWYAYSCLSNNGINSRSKLSDLLKPGPSSVPAAIQSPPATSQCPARAVALCWALVAAAGTSGCLPFPWHALPAGADTGGASRLGGALLPTLPTPISLSPLPCGRITASCSPAHPSTQRAVLLLPALSCSAYVREGGCLGKVSAGKEGDAVSFL